MKIFYLKSILIYSMIAFMSFACGDDEDEPGEQVRLDDAEQLTFSQNGESAQNPAFSPDGKQIAFETHFGEDEEYPSEIWIKEIPLCVVIEEI